MKILLCAVNAKYIHSNPAVYSLKAYCGKKYEDTIEIVEYTINHALDSILEGIYKKKPDVIGISCYIWNWEYVRKLIEALPEILPNLQIWLGGPEVSYRAGEILEAYPVLRGIMVGEGEETFLQLTEHYKEGTISLEHIKGIVYRNGEVICATGERALTDLSKIPFLYDDMTPFENRIIYYETSRGCPYRCSYCLSSIDKTVRLRNIEIVKKELQSFLDRQVSQVKFVDRTFNCNREHAMEIWKYLIEHDNGITNFHFEIEADIITDEQIALLKNARPGLMQMEIGVQTANEITLKEIRRTASVEKISEVVKKIKSGNNIHIHLDLIAGLPYEDYQSFGKSFDRVYEMEPEQLQLGFLKVLSGAYLSERVTDYGIRYLKRPPYEVLATNWISFEEIRRLKRIEEMVEIYYNSNQFVHTLQRLVKEFVSPFSMYEALADFYEENNYFVTQPARSYRYQVLLSFIEKTVRKELHDLFRELLTFDLYLRENCKSRPLFAKDLSMYKERSRCFYQDEEKCLTYLPDYSGYDAKQISKMTHMEYFTYPVWRCAEDVLSLSEGKSQMATAVVFDYAKKNPLTGDSRFCVIE